MDENHSCFGCTLCCEYVAMEIDAEDKEDWQHIVWFVSHKNVFVYQDDEGDWMIEFKTPCENLDSEGLCSIHDKRPDICKEYSWDECEKHVSGNYYQVMLKNREEALAYIKENLDFDL